MNIAQVSISQFRNTVYNTVLENRPATSNSLYPIYNSNILLIIFYIEDWGDFPKNCET